MLFSSPVFLFGFFPLLLIVYFLAAPSMKNGILLIFSLVFYAWGEPVYILAMLVSIVCNYGFALLIDKFDSRGNHKAKKAVLIISIIIALGMLFYYKYINFFIENLNVLLGLISIDKIPTLNVTMPIGISFFTFQGMSYVIDVYRKQTGAQRNFVAVALYVSLFPQLIAGPIVRYVDVEKEIQDRHPTFSGFSNGLRRFVIGLGKKVLLSNTVALIADSIFNTDISYVAASVSWVGIVCYALQIYFDFSGYSDMAIGLGKMFGFNFLENFNYPYISLSITNFWRRWHISLSTWFKDYLYIPLGGNRKGTKRTYINSIIVFFCTGFWHGASWNFIVWGLFHGGLLIFEKSQAVEKSLARINCTRQTTWVKCISYVGTMLLVLIGWVFFRANNLTHAMEYLGRMFLLSKPIAPLFAFGYYLTPKNILIILVSCIAATPILQKLTTSLNTKQLFNSFQFVRALALAGILALCIMSLASSAYNPFIYFRF